MSVDWSKVPEWANRIAQDPNGLFAAVGEHGYNHCYSVKNACQNPFKAEWLSGHFTTTQERPVQWKGEGLPPVGTVCEFIGGSDCPEDPFHPDLKAGAVATVIAHFSDGTLPLIAFTFEATNPDIGRIQVEQARPACFRPIRTAEQIAADERKAEILGMIETFGTDTSIWGRDAVMEICGHLWESGYRKQVAP